MKFFYLIIINQKISNLKPAKFDWSNAQIAALHSSFFWGYMLTQIPAGYLSTRFPANRVFGLAILASALLNFSIPLMTKTNFYGLVVLRIFQGLVDVSLIFDFFVYFHLLNILILKFKGIAFPSVHGIWRYWAPPQERSRLATISFTGIYAGAIVGFPLSGYLINNVSWESSFYVYGAAGLIWFAAWFIVSAPTPAQCALITDEERIYIESSIDTPALPKVNFLFISFNWFNKLYFNQHGFNIDFQESLKP